LGQRGRLLARLHQDIAKLTRRAEAAEASVQSLETQASNLRSDLTSARELLNRSQALNELFKAVRTELDAHHARRSGIPSSREQATNPELASVLEGYLASLREARAGSPGAITPKQVLNKGEGKVFWRLLDWVRDNDLRLAPQVSMGEYLEHARGRRDLRWTYNDRRTDFLVYDRDWKPILAVEHHGSGHFQGEWKLRDAIKAEALAIAGVGLVVTLPNDGLQAVSRKLDREYTRIKALRAEAA